MTSDLSELYVLIGKNNAGKSNILSALYNSLVVIDNIIDFCPRIGIWKDDFHKKAQHEPIEVEITGAHDDAFTIRFDRLPVRIPKLLTNQAPNIEPFTECSKTIGFIHQIRTKGKEIFRLDPETAAGYASLRIASQWLQDTRNIGQAIIPGMHRSQLSVNREYRCARRSSFKVQPMF